MELEFIKSDKILNNTLFKAKYIKFYNYYISDSSLKVICQNSYWEDLRFLLWTFYFEDTETNENEVFIKNKFKSIYFNGWKCCKLLSRVKSEEDQNYELHHSDIKDFIINFFKDTTFEDNFKIIFDSSFNYSDVTINSSNLTKLLNKSDAEISDILNINERYSKFNEHILDKINGIDHIEIQTYLNNYAIEISKLGESKFNWYSTSTFDSSFELSTLSSFHWKSFDIWSAIEFKVNNEYFIYFGEIRKFRIIGLEHKYLMMINSRDEIVELFDEDSLKKLNLDFVAYSLDFTFIHNKYDKD